MEGNGGLRSINSMDVIFMSNSGESLPIVWRLRREGVDAGMYMHHPQYRQNYDGILPLISVKDLKKALRKTDLVIFDITRPNERTKYDVILLKTFGLKSTLSSVFGPVADKLKKDHKVIGASVITEELELDRHKGIELAEKMGFAIPEYHEFGTLKDGMKFLKGRSDLWVFKPENNQDLDLTYVEKFPGEILTKIQDEWLIRIGGKCDYILQKKIDGVEVSSEVWISERGPEHFNHTLESKRFMTGNLGPAIGSQSNTVWIGKNSGLLIDPLKKMAAYLRKEGYIGPCDANCIVKGSTPYFLEWSPRFGYDAIYCLLTLLKGSLSDFFLKDFKADFHSGYAASQRVSIPPYPYALPSLRQNFAKDVSIMNSLERTPFMWWQDIYSDAGKLKVAGADGILGVASARDENLEAAWGKVHSAIDKLKVCSYLQYRTDGFKEHSKRVEKLKVA